MIKDEAFSLQENLITWRRHLHQNPEVGQYLPQTRAYVCAVLDEMGIEYRLYEKSSAIEALVRGESKASGGEGPTIALRCDMDGLPITETTGLTFASTNGAMHGCGHDTHTAMLLGAVSILNQHRKELHGNVKFLFQPGEEGYYGASSMVEEGALEHPHVDAMVGMHVTNTIAELLPGCIGYKKGPILSGCDEFTITITGKGGHISDMDFVVNPYFAAAKIIEVIKEISLDVKTRPLPSVIALASMKGGDASNIIPDTVEMLGSIRTMDAEAREEIIERLAAGVKEAADAEGCTAEVNVEATDKIVFNDFALTEKVKASLEKVFAGEDKVVEITSTLMASEDISYFFEHTTGSYLHLGCGFDDGREIFPLHNPNFVFNEDVLWRGSAAFAQAALDYLTC